MVRFSGFLSKGKLLVLRTCGTSAMLLLLFCAPGHAAESSTGKLQQNILKSESPLHIASDRMEVKQKEKTILFEGHVVVRQEDLTISGNRMRVYAAEGDKTGKAADSAMMEKIDRIEVEGDVRITQKEKMATADKAVYYHQDQKIVLMGNPVVSQGQDKVEGRLITLYLAEERSVVEGGKAAPVQAVLHPAPKE